MVHWYSGTSSIVCFSATRTHKFTHTGHRFKAQRNADGGSCFLPNSTQWLWGAARLRSSGLSTKLAIYEGLCLHSRKGKDCSGNTLGVVADRCSSVPSLIFFTCPILYLVEFSHSGWVFSRSTSNDNPSFIGKASMAHGTDCHECCPTCSSNMSLKCFATDLGFALIPVETPRSITGESKSPRAATIY